MKDLIKIYIWGKFRPEVVFQWGKHSALKIFQKFEFWLKWNACKFSFGPFWGPTYCQKTKNIAYNQNFWKTYILRNIKKYNS